MSNDRDLDLLMDQWMAGGPTDAADRLKDEAMAEVVVTPQMTGRTLQGRLPTMSALKYVAFFAIIAIATANLAMLASDGIAETTETRPAAQYGPGVPARVTGTTEGILSDGNVGYVAYEGGWRGTNHGMVYDGTYVADDARLTGDALVTSNYDLLQPGNAAVETLVVHLENESGAWDGSLQGAVFPGLEDRGLQGVLTGSGAYEGLSAYLIFDRDFTEYDFEGMIFPGSMPEAP